MRCKACDCALNDVEATRKSVASGEFLDLCDACYDPISVDVPTVERYDLYHTDVNSDDDFTDG